MLHLVPTGIGLGRSAGSHRLVQNRRGVVYRAAVEGFTGAPEANASGRRGTGLTSQWTASCACASDGKTRDAGAIDITEKGGGEPTTWTVVGIARTSRCHLQVC